MDNDISLDEDLAEFVGAFIGDGCLSEYHANDRKSKRRMLYFSGNWKNDKEYHEKRILPIINKNSNLNVKVRRRKCKTALQFSTCNNNIINFLLSLGFSFGEKHKTVKIPEMFIGNDNIIKACIRGVFNTDGSVYRRYSKIYKKYGFGKNTLNYAIVQIKSNSSGLLNQIKSEMERMGYTTNRIVGDGKTSNVFRITKQSDIKRFFTEISTTHPYHINRYKNIKHNKPIGIMGS